MEQQEYYQIFENQRPLARQIFPTKRAANAGLNDLFQVLQKHGEHMGYKVENRLQFIPIRHNLAIRRTYIDGTTIHDSYFIRRIYLMPSYDKKF